MKADQHYPAFDCYETNQPGCCGVLYHRLTLGSDKKAPENGPRSGKTLWTSTDAEQWLNLLLSEP